MSEPLASLRAPVASIRHVTFVWVSICDRRCHIRLISSCFGACAASRLLLWHRPCGACFCLFCPGPGFLQLFLALFDLGIGCTFDFLFFLDARCCSFQARHGRIQLHSQRTCIQPLGLGLLNSLLQRPAELHDAMLLGRSQHRRARLNFSLELAKHDHDLVWPCCTAGPVRRIPCVSYLSANPSSCRVLHRREPSPHLLQVHCRCNLAHRTCRSIRPACLCHLYALVHAPRACPLVHGVLRCALPFVSCTCFLRRRLP